MCTRNAESPVISAEPEENKQMAYDLISVVKTCLKVLKTCWMVRHMPLIPAL